MKFGPVPVALAENALLAHSLRVGGTSWRKGRRLSAADLVALDGAGIGEVIAARLEPGDIVEDAAAGRLASALTGSGLTRAAAFTGRCNIIAQTSGIVQISPGVIDALNAVDEAITVATVPAFATVTPKQLVATVKIIPFALPETLLDRCLSLLDGPPLRLHAYRGLRAALIQTALPGTKPGVLAATVDITRARLARWNAELVVERQCGHEVAALAQALQTLPPVDLILLVGASAVVDRRDVLPVAITRVGGRIRHFGMPVDPGNLLLLAEWNGRPVLGLPGCARSPRLNGADWVMQRLCAGLDVTPADIMGLGVGGLLTEIGLRGQPREVPRAPHVAALVLAAGQARRMGRDKLMLPLDGLPLGLHAVDAALAVADQVVMVTGPGSAGLASALADRPVTLIANDDPDAGLSRSLRLGLAALPAEAEAVLVCLADMPRLRPEDLARMIAAFEPDDGRAIVLPVHDGRRGNPILWARRFFPEMAALEGDQGARSLLQRHAELIAEIPVDHDGVLMDVDTPAAYAALTGKDNAA